MICYVEDDVTYVFCGLIMQFREAFIIILALPHLSEVNEIFDELSNYLSRADWGCNISNTVGTNGSNVNETLLLTVNCLRLWAATIDRPLSMYILGINGIVYILLYYYKYVYISCYIGRKVKKLEMRRQIITIAVLGLGSVLSYVIGIIYQNI